MKSFFIENKKNIGFWIWMGVMLVLFFGLPILSHNAGMSGDENDMMLHAEKVVNFWKTAGKDTAAVVSSGRDANSQLYGQTPDNLALVIAKALNIEDILAVRHIVVGFFGWLCLLFAGLFAYRVSKKWTAALFTVLLLLLSPRFLGHAFNNTKDIPFAAMLMMGLFYIYRFLEQLPKPKISTCLLLAVSIGLAIGIRVPGLLLIAYFGLFALVYFFFVWRKNLLTKTTYAKSFFQLLLYGLVVTAAAYVIAVLIWPFATIKPFTNIATAFKEMTHFQISLRQLFEGSLQWSDQLPWYYTPKYILMTIPIAVMIGFLFYSFIGGWKKEYRFTTFMLYFACIFPIFWIIYSNANVYGGWRHALFAYPPMVVVAGLGFSALVDFVKLQITNYELRKNPHFQFSIFNFQLKMKMIPYYIVIALPFLLLIPPTLHMLRNHPYEYIYFNEFTGGMNKVYGNYEMDYYFHTTREATEWIKQDAEKTFYQTSFQDGQKIKVATWHLASVNYFLRKDTTQFRTVFVRWYERGNSDWDYAIFPITGMAPEQIKSEHFPPKNCVHTIDVDGKPVCLILKRDDKSDLLGFQYKQKNSKDTANYYLSKALAHDPYNEAALLNLIELDLQNGILDSAKILIDRGLSYLPANESLLYFSAYYHLGKQERDQAIQNCEEIIRLNFKFRGAYHLLTNIYLQQQDIKNAEKILMKMIDADQLDNQGMQQLVAIYQTEGMNERTAYKKLYRVMAKSFEKRGKEKEAKEYADMAKRM